MNEHCLNISNVLIIGCGGSGLRAAIEASKNNVSVKILGKRPRTDSHTVLAAGGINAALGNLDAEDSWEQHFSDTYLEGYKIGDPHLIEVMAKNAPSIVQEIDEWGANFEKLENGKLNQRYFGAHTYRRTCFSGDYTGQAILKALLRKVKTLNIPIADNQYVTDLLVENSTCFGAMSFNMETGQRIVELADSVILCTGGHTRIWKRSSSREHENTGDGLFLALKAGCSLIDMEMVQFHPTGMLYPEAVSGTLVTEAVRGEGGKLINNLGKRFMEDYDEKRMELSTRDIVAMANYNEIMEGRGTPNGGVYLDISHKSKDFIIKKLPKIYRQFLESQMLDISKEAMEVAPTAHYSMGGILVNSIDHSTNIKGLYAAGEVAGGLHGANRLGGNSLAEILIFGKIAGKFASEFSKQIELHNRSLKSIENAHKNINKKIKKGNEFALPLIKELSNIMWDYCGVIKNENNLDKGLNKINKLKEKYLEIDVRIDDKNFSDLINVFELEASIKTAECTIVSALSRRESRGAHQRSDYPNLDHEYQYSNKLKIIDSKIFLEKSLSKNLTEHLNDFVKHTNKINNYKNKLLE